MPRSKSTDGNEKDAGSHMIELLEAMETRIIEHFDTKIASLTDSMNQNSARINKLEEDAKNADAIKKAQQSTIDSLSARIDALEKLCSKQAIQLKVLDVRQTDQTDRNSRNSLIIRGVPEGENETWDDTRKVLCDTLAPIINIEPANISRMIERVHRGGGNPTPANRRDNKPRIILARLLDWNNVENIKDLEHSIQTNTTNCVHCNYH